MKKLLFYVLVVTFPLGVLTRISIFPAVNIYLGDIIIVLILLFSRREILTFLKKRNSFMMFYSLFALVGVVGVIGNVREVFEIASSLSYVARLTCYMLLIIPVINLDKKVLSNLKNEMIVVGFIFIFLGYVQYLYYPALRNLYYLGWDEHLYRLFSTLLDPNFAGAFIVLIMLLFSAFAFENFQRSNIQHRTFYVLGYIFFFPALLLTYSRSSYIMVFFSLVLFFILIKQKKLVLILVATLTICVFFLPKGLGGEGVKLFRTASIFARTAQYENSLKIISDNPIMGVGFNSLRFVSGQYGFILPKDMLISHAGAGVPNSYLFVFVTTGISGFILFLTFMFMTMKKIWAVRKRKVNKIYAVCVFASILGVLAVSLFDNFLFYPQIMLWLILLVGILFGSGNSVGRDKE